jgi:hypothetical protein
MKKLLLIPLVLLLNGCVLLDSYLMARFDANEYRIISEIRTDAAIYKKECNDSLLSRPNSQALTEKTQLFVNYSEHIPRNSNVIKAGQQLHDIAQGLSDSYHKPKPPSAAFCRIKFETVETNASAMQRIIGNRPR